MNQRLDPIQAAPDAIEAVLALSGYVSRCGLEPQLLNLVKMRASQMNGCAFCLGMHRREPRAQGETEQRLYLLSAWREAPFYTDRERAALAWTEALTRVAEAHAPGAWDDVKLLTVTVNRLEQWWRPGLLCIGDAAHAMSPIAGVRLHEGLSG